MKLQQLGAKSSAVASGKAMFNFSSSTASIKEKDEIVISARLGPINSVIALDTTLLTPGALEWPSFHDGVADGLKIPSKSIFRIESNILNQETEIVTCHHAGYLLALGISGHLTRMKAWRSYLYLLSKQELAHVGLMVGLGCAYIGTEDSKTVTLLSIHIPSLHPSGSAEMHSTLLVQTSCIIGMGLLYMETHNRGTIRTLMNELGCKQNSEESELHEGYALASGFAVGCILLGKGKTSEQSHMNIIDELVEYMQGNQKKSAKIGRNVDIIPGSIVALTLMFLKTNNRQVAKLMHIPTSMLELDMVRPDFLLLKVIGKNLILWNDIVPSLEWIDSQIPEFIKSTIKASGRFTGEENNQQTNSDHELIHHAYLCIITGCIFSIALKYAGSAQKSAFETILYWMDILMIQAAKKAVTFSEKLSKSISQSCLDSVVLSIGVVMSGTGNLALFQKLKGLHSQPLTGDLRYGNFMATSMSIGFLFLGKGRFTLSNSMRSIACLYISLYPKMPYGASDNKCHLQALRHLWAMAVEDRCLITRDSITHNICPIPIIVSVKVGNTAQDIKMSSPCNLPPFEKIIGIRLNSPRYWRLDLDGDFPYWKHILKNKTIYAKRRMGYLDYVEVCFFNLGSARFKEYCSHSISYKFSIWFIKSQKRSAKFE